MSERLYVLDVNSLAHFKHHSVSDSSEHGDLVEGVGFWLSAFRQHFDPRLFVAAFDCSRESSWRKKLSADYKANRDIKPPDEALKHGLQQLPVLLNRMGFPALRVEGEEADDLLATFAMRHDGEVMLITSDSDMHQLIDNRVRVYDPRANAVGLHVLYDVKTATVKHKVPPHRLREKKAIMGENGDNIAGIKGLGDVFACTVIQQTRSRLELERRALDGSLTNITPRQSAMFKDGIEDFRLAWQLIGLHCDVPILGGFDMRMRAETE